MRQRTLTILLVLLVVIGVIAFLSLRREAKAPRHDGGGRALFADLPVNSIAAIQILSPEGAVSLRKDSAGWVVGSHFDYPADFTMITELVRKVKELKAVRSFEATEEIRIRRALQDPAEQTPAAAQGTRIDLLDAEEGVLGRLILGQTWTPGGKEGATPEGQYLLVPGQPQAYIVDRHFAYLRKQPEDWLDDMVSQVAATEIREVSCRQGAVAAYAFKRDEPGEEFVPVELPAGAEIDKAALGELLGAMGSLRFEKVYPMSQVPAAFGSGKLWELSYRLFNGLVYHAVVMKGDEENPACLLRLEVDYQAPEGDAFPQQAGADPTGGKQAAATAQASAAEAVSLNARLSPWVYELSEWKCRAFKTDMRSLLVNPAQETDSER